VSTVMKTVLYNSILWAVVLIVGLVIHFEDSRRPPVTTLDHNQSWLLWDAYQDIWQGRAANRSSDLYKVQDGNCSIYILVSWRGEASMQLGPGCK